MRQLISLSLVVAAAVLVTVLAKFNAGKVAIFINTTRIDFSLNLAIVLFVLIFVGLWLVVGAFRASSRMPGRVRGFFTSRKQKGLNRANTDAVIALITGDERLAERALSAAQKTGLEGDLSYLIRALSAVQADRFDVAERMLEQDKAEGGDHSQAIQLLKAQVALAKGNFTGALELLELMNPGLLKSPQAAKVKLKSLIGLSRWTEALSFYRQTELDRHVIPVEREQLLGEIYQGLSQQHAGQLDPLKALAKDAKPNELTCFEVLEPLCNALLQVNQLGLARKLLENSLNKHLRSDVLALYQKVALSEPREALVFVEKLVADHPGDVNLVELAANVCESEQLWGKAISRFEWVYQQQATAHVAGRLARLYDLANQPEKSRAWQDKVKLHLGLDSQVA